MHDATPPTGSFWAAIPAGGSGTRLWPLSRASRPKFLLPLVGERSLLQETVRRLDGLATPATTLVVCGPQHAAAVARQLPQVPDANIVVEPFPRGSGSAIGLAAALIARQDPEAIMGSFAADHEVLDPVAFAEAIRTAIAAAEEGWLVTIGLAPTRPETGYGYIERSDEAIAQRDGQRAYRSLRFHEKPDRERAEQYVASGRFLWNASMFVWRVQTLLEEMRRQMPELHAAVQRIAEVWGTPAQESVTAEVWDRLSDVTIDHGIMEHAARVAVVPAEMGWSDVGDWHGLGELIHKDAVGNSVHGDLLQVDAHHCVVWSETGRLVAVVGLDNVVIVDTADALMVVDRGRAQDVKKIVDQLKALHRSET